ncbi:hypothetical protein RI129_002964 [Pyrocoelia pectoralis]|uniref:THAP-type domain-containing protein n=1 Tax=Pyrocoelia pectoralis TaxID=417401 RepID=A0AAN7VHD9_9COLE
MGYTKCCLSNCNATVLPLHRFPNRSKYLLRFKEWVEKIGNEDLLNMDPFEVYNRKRACHKHFDSQFYSEGLNIINQEYGKMKDTCEFFGRLPLVKTMLVVFQQLVIFAVLPKKI